LPAVSSVQLTGDAYIDGVLSGTKWAASSLTYSFPTDATYYGTAYGNGEPANAFEAFTAQQQDGVRKILQMYSSFTKLTFTEVSETSTQHGDLRYAESDSLGTAWAYYPTTSAVGGDAWFNNSKNYYDNSIKGNYAYLTMLHESGHALGLKHPHEVKGLFNAMPADHDSLEYSVMSYHSYVGSPLSGYTNGTYSYPQTLMMYDIAALQEMYGANYSTNNGNTVYSWSATTGQTFIDGVGQTAPGGNIIFMTMWDGGGIDSYNFSNYTTNLTVNLNPGAWTTASSTQLAYLGSGHYAAGNIANALLFDGNVASLIENAVGGSGNDMLIGNVADNWLTGGTGADYLDGGAGGDTAIYSGGSLFYTWVKNADGSWSITDLRSGNPDGVDTLLNIELLQFSDMVVALDSYTPPPPPPVNQAPTITSGAQSSSLTEWADLSANEVANALHVGSGQITFADADTGDSHLATFAAKGTGYLGTFSLNTSSIDTTDSVGWSFSLADSAMDYLKAGQTLTQMYDVTVDDGHGGFATHTVTITLVGASDAVTKGGGKGGSGGPGKKGAGEDMMAHGVGVEGTPAEVHSRSAVVGMSGDQAPAPVELTETLGVLGVLPLEFDWMHS
jgi:serralysin